LKIFGQEIGKTANAYIFIYNNIKMTERNREKAKGIKRRKWANGYK